MGYPGWPAVSPPPPEQQTQALEAQARYFENALEDIRRRLAELQAAQESEG